jgi:hypothetical protein
LTTVAHSRSFARLWQFVAVEYALVVALWLVLDLLPRWLGLSLVRLGTTGLSESFFRTVVVYVLAYLLV